MGPTWDVFSLAFDDISAAHAKITVHASRGLFVAHRGDILEGRCYGWDMFTRRRLLTTLDAICEQEQVGQNPSKDLNTESSYVLNVLILVYTVVHECNKHLQKR